MTQRKSALDRARSRVKTSANGTHHTEPAETQSRASVPEYQPFPVDALPGQIRGFVAAGAEAIGCDPSYLALPLLTAIGAAIGNTRRLEVRRGWYVPPILWSAVVGESGSMKTPAFKLVMRPVRERQTQALKRHAEAERQHAVELAQWEKEFAAWKRSKTGAADPPERPEPPHAERLAVSDTTVEALALILAQNPRGVLLARDELAGWLGSFDRYAGGKGGADAANWLSMHNAEAVTVDRKTGTPRTIHVPQAAVCVAGGIQPGILQRALGAEHRESGLAARLLLACPPRAVKRWTEADIDPAAEARLAALFDRLYGLQPTTDEDEKGEPRPALVKLTPEAKAVWVAYYDAHALEQVDLDGDLSAAWSKLEEYAARLALVIHFARWAAADPTLSIPDRVDSESMNAAVKLTAWFKGEAIRVYGLFAATPEERQARALAELVCRKGGSMSPRDLQRANSRTYPHSAAAEAALDALVSAGFGRWDEAGRSRVFQLHTTEETA